MFEGRECMEWGPQDGPADFDADALLERYPWARRHFEDDPSDDYIDPAWLAELNALPPEGPERVILETDRPLCDRDPDTFSDAEAITRLIEVEAGITRSHALRARLVALVAAQRPAWADRPDGCPGAAGWENRLARKTGSGATAGSGDGTQLAAESAGSAADQDGRDGQDVVPEILPVSEWLSHELQMAHPYSRTAALDLVETSLILSGRLSATLGLLAAGRIDYPRARIAADLLGTCTEEVAHTVEAMVLPRAPGLTPGGLAAAIRRALAQVDAAALRRRHARARRAAEVGYYPTQDGMARLYADLPLPVAAACSDGVDRYAKTQQGDGDDRPAGRVRTEVLTDLILRPWDTTRPTVTGEVTIHLTIPATGAASTCGLDDDAAHAEVDGQTITAANAGNCPPSCRAPGCSWPCTAMTGTCRP